MFVGPSAEHRQRMQRCRSGRHGGSAVAAATTRISRDLPESPRVDSRM